MDYRSEEQYDWLKAKEIRKKENPTHFEIKGLAYTFDYFLKRYNEISKFYPYKINETLFHGLYNVEQRLALANKKTATKNNKFEKSILYSMSCPSTVEPIYFYEKFLRNHSTRKDQYKSLKQIINSVNNTLRVHPKYIQKFLLISSDIITTANADLIYAKQEFAELPNYLSFEKQEPVIDELIQVLPNIVEGMRKCICSEDNKFNKEFFDYISQNLKEKSENNEIKSTTMNEVYWLHDYVSDCVPEIVKGQRRNKKIVTDFIKGKI